MPSLFFRGSAEVPSDQSFTLTDRSSVIDPASKEATKNAADSFFSIAGTISGDGVSSQVRHSAPKPGRPKVEFSKSYVRSHYFDSPEQPDSYTFWEIQLYGDDYDAIEPGGGKVTRGRQRVLGSISATLSDQNARAQIPILWKKGVEVDPTEEQLNSHLTTLKAQRSNMIREGKKTV